jgi:hypothetical protein
MDEVTWFVTTVGLATTILDYYARLGGLCLTSVSRIRFAFRRHKCRHLQSLSGWDILDRLRSIVAYGNSKSQGSSHRKAAVSADKCVARLHKIKPANIVLFIAFFCVCRIESSWHNFVYFLNAAVISYESCTYRIWHVIFHLLSRYTHIQC